MSRLPEQTPNSQDVYKAAGLNKFERAMWKASNSQAGRVVDGVGAVGIATYVAADFLNIDPTSVFEAKIVKAEGPVPTPPVFVPGNNPTPGPDQLNPPISGGGPTPDSGQVNPTVEQPPRTSEPSPTSTVVEPNHPVATKIPTEAPHKTPPTQETPTPPITVTATVTPPGSTETPSPTGTTKVKHTPTPTPTGTVAKETPKAPYTGNGSSKDNASTAFIVLAAIGAVRSVAALKAKDAVRAVKRLVNRNESL